MSGRNGRRRLPEGSLIVDFVCDDDSVGVICYGEFDLTTASILDDAISDGAGRAAGRTLVLDLSGLHFCSVAILQRLRRAALLARASATTLEVVEGRVLARLLTVIDPDRRCYEIGERDGRS
ncbi:MAG TPA: hypothetical protein VM841_10870 [Actinomycetota bacterium]|nr:hypothetical protein [Actinomycetota bacterium]